MKTSTYKLLLADDDPDDRIFFREALEDLPVSATLTTANDGVELMHLLTATTNALPDILFLDLNMPRKTGYQCLSEIRLSPQLKNLRIIVLSTSFDYDMVNLLYENGADYYIRKPGEFSKLKELLYKAIQLIAGADETKPGKESFVLNAV